MSAAWLWKKDYLFKKKKLFDYQIN